MESTESSPPDLEQLSEAQTTNFEFVLSPNQRGVRSHAMREYWRQRRTHSKDGARATRRPRQLLPNNPDPPSSQSSQSSSDHACNVEHRHTTHQQQLARSQLNSTNPSPTGTPMALSDALAALPDGIPTQFLAGANRALACSQLDPFDAFPVKLTAQHHKLLHHCEFPQFCSQEGCNV